MKLNNILLSIFTIILFASLVSAADPGHSASVVGPGSFETGNYSFPGSLNITLRAAIGTISNSLATLGINSSSAFGSIRIINGSGSEHFFINGTSGFVGIGTTTPQAKFVVSDAGATGIELSADDANHRATITTYDRVEGAYKTLRILGNNISLRGDGSTDHLVVTSTGKVGIGTTNPIALLHLGTGNITLSGGWITNVSNPLLGSDVATKAYVDSLTGGAGSSVWSKSGSNVYLNTTSDSVGIGLASPTSKLEVNGSVAGGSVLKINSGINQGNAVYLINASAGNSATVYYLDDTGLSRQRYGAYFGNTGSNAGAIYLDAGQANSYPSIRLWDPNGATQRVQISSNGSNYLNGDNLKLGIGTSNPGATLHVNGTISSEAFYSSSDDALIGYYPFSEGSGTAVSDKSKSGAKATLVGTPSWNSSGKFGNSIVLNGVNQYATVAVPSSLNVSFSAWINPTDNTPGGEGIGNIVGGGGIYQYLSLSTNFRTYNGSEWIGTTTTAPNNAWTHVALSYDGTTRVLKLYVNGVLERTASASYTNSYATTIGIYSDGTTRPFNGTLDEIRFYGRILDADEVRAQYSAGLGATAPYVDAYTGNVGIGTTNPQAKLHVAGNITSGGWITNLSNPLVSTDAATKAYVDSITGGSGVTPWSRSSPGVTYVNNTADNVSIGSTTATDKLFIQSGNGDTSSGGTLGLSNGAQTYRFYFTSTNNNLYLGVPGFRLGGFSPQGDVAFGGLGGDSIPGGAPKFYMNGSTGYVGIGTQGAQPGYNLQVAGNASFNSTLYVTTAGNVGIGTITPGYKLDVNGTAHFSQDTQRNAFILYNNASGNTGTVLKLGDNSIGLNSLAGAVQFTPQAGLGNAFSEVGGGWETNTSNGYLSFSTTMNGATLVERMRINNLGYVGIGTTTPTERLSVAPNTDSNVTFGRAYIGYANTPSWQDNAIFSHYDFASNTGYSFAAMSTGATRINAASGQTISFWLAGNTQAATISSSGFNIASNITIGGWLTNLSTPLVGTDAATKAYVDAATGGAGSTVWSRISTGVIYANTSSDNVSIGAGTVSKDRLTVNGGIGIINGSLWQPTYASDDGLVGAWSFSEGTGSTVYDSGPNGIDGTITPGSNGFITTTSQMWNGGKYGNALRFDGNDSYVDIGNRMPELFNGTVELWFKRDSTIGSSYEMLFTDGGSRLEITAVGTSIYFYVNNSAISAASTADGQWHHIAGTFDTLSSSRKLYLDGVLVATGSYSGSATALTRYIGSRAGGYPFNGTVDEVRVYSRALSADEIRNQYLSGLQSDSVVRSNYFRVVNSSAQQVFTVNGSNGNVGIGTTSPDSNLQVVTSGVSGGTVKIGNSSGTAAHSSLVIDRVGTGGYASQLYFRNAGTTKGYIYNANEDIFKIDTGTGVDLQLMTAGNNVLRITSGGNVGINTTNPIETLNVRGGAIINTSINSDRGLIIDDTGHSLIFTPSASATGWAFIGSKTNHRLDLGVNNAAYLTIATSNAGVGIGTTTPSRALDVRGIGNFSGTVYINNGTDISTLVSGSDDWNISGSSLFPKDLSYNVGLGINNPTYRLDVSESRDQHIARFVNTNASVVSAGAAILVQGNSGETSLDYGQQRVGGGIILQNLNTTANVYSGLNFLDASGNGVAGISAIFRNDTNNEGDLAFATRVSGGNYAEKVRILGSGNVGINTTSPSSLLTVNGRIEADSLMDNRYEGAQISFGGTSAAASKLRFFTGNDLSTEKVHINGSGFVGIGTANPGAKLEISGGWSSGQALDINYGSASGSVEAINFVANGGANGVIGMQMVSAGVGDLWLGGSGGRSLTLYRDGNVGIGTTTPEQALHVKAAYGRVKLESTNAGTSNWSLNPDSSPAGFHINENSATRFTVANGGNVGIGISSIANSAGFTKVLQINSSGSSVASFKTSASSTQQFDLGVADPAGSGSNDFGLYDSTTGAWRFVVKQNSGNLGIGTTTPSRTLDVRGIGNFSGTVYINNGTDLSAFVSGNGTGTYVPYVGANANVNLGVYNLTTLGRVGIAGSPTQSNLFINGSIESLIATGGNSYIKHYQDVASFSGTVSPMHAITGELVVGMPSNWSEGMVHVKIQGYDYTSRGAWEVIVGGYSYTGSQVWINTNVEISGRPPFTQVRLASNGTRNVIILGNATTVWSYPQLVVSDVIVGYSGQNNWGVGWSIYNTTVESNLVSIATPTVHRYTDQGGNMGIGTAYPTATLQVQDAGDDANPVLTIKGGPSSVYDATLRLEGEGAINNEGFLIRYDNDVGDVYINQTYAGLTGTTPAIRFSTGVTPNAVVIAGGGNVGIGTATPGQKLEVNGNIRIGSLGNLSFGSADSVKLVDAGSNNLAIYTTSLERVRIDGSGNVGIGTTSPKTKLDVSGAIRQFDGNGGWNLTTNGSNAPSLQLLVSDSSVRSKIELIDANTATERVGFFMNPLGTLNEVLSISKNGNVSFNSNYITNVATPLAGTDAATKAYVDALNASSGAADDWNLSGSDLFPKSVGYIVGIGTTDPGYSLDVNGTGGQSADFTGYSGDSSGIYPKSMSPQLRIKRPFNYSVNGATYRGGLIIGEGGVGIYSVNPNPSGSPYYGDLRFFTTYWNGSDYHNADRLVISQDTGYIGINTTSPTSALTIGSVAGNFIKSGITTNDWGAQYAFGVAPGNGILVSKNGTTNDANRLAVIYRDATEGGQIHLFNNTGTSTSKNVHISAGGVSYFNGGNVGINSTSPTSTLEVKGTFNASTTNGGVSLQQTGDFKIGI